MNSINLLVGGSKAFDTIISNINGAQQNIKVNMFIWRDDQIGNKMALALINAANRGVKVHISKDKLGMLFEYAEEHKHSFFHHNLLTRWYIQSIILDKMYPMQGKDKRKYKDVNPNYLKIMKHPNISIDSHRVKMDHSKYYIIDNEILILGGINIEDKEVTMDVSGMSYHDYMVEIRNPQIVRLFKRRLYGNKKYNSEAKIDFIFNRNIFGNKDFKVKANIINLLNQAQSKVNLVMAYIGDSDINNCIEQLINKGVQVDLYLSSQANLQHDLNMKNLKDLMVKTDNKIQVFLSDKMIHAKLINIDNRIITVGSTNLNSQAMEVLTELNVVLKNDRTNKEIKMFFNELASSIEELKTSSLLVNHYDELSYNKVKAFFEGLV